MGEKVEDTTGIIWDDEVNSKPKKNNTNGVNVLKPLGREYTRQEEKYITNLNKRISSFQDPERISIALKAIGSGATLDSIGRVVGQLQREETMIKNEQKISLDRRKISQNIVKDFAELGTVGKHIESLIDNFDKSNIGMFDSSDTVQWLSRQFDIGDGIKRDGQDSSISAIETSLKKIAGYGANYAENEQALMRKFMPSVSDGEQAYKNQVYNSALNLRRDLSSRIDAQDLAGYESNDLKKMISNLDGLIRKADNFRRNVRKKPKNLRSLTGKKTPTRQIVISSSKDLDDWLD